MIHQFTKLIKTHLKTTFFMFIIGIFLFASLVTNKTGGVVFSTIATMIYFVTIYFSAFNVCKEDKKSYTNTKPHIWKGLILPAGIWIVSALFYALYIVSWKYIAIANQLVSITAWINNFLFIFWSFIFNGFINVYQGNMLPIGYILIIVIPAIASELGYIAGYYNIDIKEKIDKIVYEKKNKEEN